MIRKLVCLSALGMMLFAGCISPDTFDFLSAIGKINRSDPAIGDLTGAEWAALSNHGPDIAQDMNLGLTDEQIAAIPAISAAEGDVIAKFLDDNGIDTLSELQTLATEVANGTTTVVVPDEVRKLVDKIWTDVDWGNS